VTKVKKPPGIQFIDDSITLIGPDNGSEAAFDYLIDAPVAAPQWIVDDVRACWDDVRLVGKALRLGEASVFLLPRDSRRAVARFLSGIASDEGWAMVLFWKPHAKVPEYIRPTAVAASVFHEMAHAYIESCGIEDVDGEEDEAEAFGRACSEGDAKAAISRLRRFSMR